MRCGKRSTNERLYGGCVVSLLDGISIGELDDEARDAAKVRRKKLNAALEEELMPGGNSVRGKVVKAKNAAGM